MTVTTIPSSYSFIEILAESLLRNGVEAVSETLVLLPNRRACRSLKESMVQKAKGQAFILPRMMPFADLDVEDIVLSPQWIREDILPPISHVERQGILMQLIIKYGQVIGESGYGQAAHAAQLARELARLIDQIHWEGLSFEQIHELVPEDYAQHWQVTLDFLKIMTEYWPQILSDRGASDPAAWRRDLILSYAKNWQDNPPCTPVIAAGSTGSIPCTAKLLEVVQKLPQGRVVLPGLDQELSDKEWDNLEITHPQYGMAKLLNQFSLARSDVGLEVHLHINYPAAHARVGLLTKALQPSIGSGWSVPESVASEALKDLKICEVKSQTEEAGIIALFMRDAIETPHKSIALVTPDRSLVERVKTELKRWDLHADDTGGQSLVATPEGCLLLLLAGALMKPDSIIPLLTVLQHPMVSVGDSSHFKEFVHQFDKNECRLHRTLTDILNCPDTKPDVAAFLKEYIQVAAPFIKLLESGEVQLKDLIDAHLTVAKFLTSNKFLQGEYREELIDFWGNITSSMECFPAISAKDYPALLQQLMLPVSVRQPHGYHPRLFILGPLEARSIKADVMILGGLNEGSWPPLTETDPWLNRPMRSDYGLPLPERRIGLSAHDFVQAFCAKEVICTRATRINGTPSVPARWLQRVQTVFKASGQNVSTTPEPWLSWYQQLDRPDEIIPCSRPAPTPPREARPTQLSVTQIEMWMRDPYSLYAKKILKLQPLDELENPLNVAKKGILIHDILETFVKSGKTTLNELLQTGEQIFSVYREQPEVMNFWWPRFKRIAAWFVEVEAVRKFSIAQTLTESTGAIVIPTSAGPFTLTAKADRIDLLKSGSSEIIDYKTGVLPSKNEIEKGFAPQLTLEAALVQAGGFKDIGCRAVHALHYWRLRGSDPAGEIRSQDSGLEDLVQDAMSGLITLIETYSNESVPYLAQPRARYALRYNPYAHLTRAQEWMRENVA